MRDTIIIAVISAMTSGGVLAFLQFLITRNDDKQGIKSTLKKLEKDGLRTQLLLLILLKPPAGLGGNWYMTSIFKGWCDEHKLEPDWFKSE